MSEERTNHDKAKLELSRELDTVLKAAISSPYSSKEFISSEITQNVCNVIEAVFIHGLRDPFFLKGSRYAKYPEPNFWPFVSKYSHRSITSQISNLNQIKSEIGKGRAWIRIVLNESSLEHYVNLLLQESRAMNQFYNDHAFLRDTDHIERMGGFLKGLSRLPIKSAINSSFLNAWTPSPLILAGLVAGKAIQVGSLAPSRKPSEQVDSDEVGMSALDMLPLLGSPIKMQRPTTANRNINVNLSDDDASSVYSHPSMLDRTDRILSSTPINEDVLLSQGIAPLLVSRRTKRPRRSSRSSSESKESRDQSLSESVSTTAGPSDALPEVRTNQSETLDSGVESENRNGSTLDTGSISSLPEHERSSSASGENATSVDLIVDNVFHSDFPTVEEENLMQTPPTEIAEPASDVDVPEVEEDVGVQHDLEKASSAVDIPSSANDSKGLCLSLHDELSAIPFSSEPLHGNSLMGGGWAVPRQLHWENDNSLLSSSSGTESSGCVVSFGQALRSAMEQVSPTEEGLDAASASEIDDTEETSRKSSVQDDTDRRLTSIARERGLVAQEHRCPMCRKSIGPTFGFAKYGVCGIDGQYYCCDCMRPGGMYSVPARVLLSWDWTPREVSDRGRAFVDANLERTAFDISKLNPSLYDHVPMLCSIKKLRERLQLVSMYLFNCRESIAEDFKKRVWPRDYLYNDVHIYSFMDLQNVHNGHLEKQLSGWLKYAIGHVMNCQLCRQKGFVCEVCDRRDVIYPFNTDSTHRCAVCLSLFHLECSSSPCPKCERRARYESTQEANDLPLG